MTGHRPLVKKEQGTQHDSAELGSLEGLVLFWPACPIDGLKSLLVPPEEETLSPVVLGLRDLDEDDRARPLVRGDGESPRALRKIAPAGSCRNPLRRSGVHAREARKRGAVRCGIGHGFSRRVRNPRISRSSGRGSLILPLSPSGDQWPSAFPGSRGSSRDPRRRGGPDRARQRSVVARSLIARMSGFIGRTALPHEGRTSKPRRLV